MTTGRETMKTLLKNIKVLLTILSVTFPSLVFAQGVDPHITSGVAVALPIELISGAPTVSGNQGPTVMLANGQALNYVGTAYQVQITLSGAEASSITDLYLQTHNLSYDDKGIVVINGNRFDLTNCNTTLNSKLGDCAAPSNVNNLIRLNRQASQYGGIGGPVAVMSMMIPVPSGVLKAGVNTIYFVFNMVPSEGLSIGYRILNFNLILNNGSPLLSPSAFSQFDPSTLVAPVISSVNVPAEQAKGCNFSAGLNATTLNACGKHLWMTAQLNPNVNVPAQSPIQARCTMCHFTSGKDLSFFNFSNNSIIERSKFHGLSPTEGAMIASFIRSLRDPIHDKGRVWNPVAQPGPGVADSDIYTWVAGAGLNGVLNHDKDMMPYIFPSGAPSEAQIDPSKDFKVRDIPVSLPLLTWMQMLPRVHPVDAFGRDVGVSLKSIDDNGHVTYNVTSVPTSLGWTSATQADAQLRLERIQSDSEAIANNLQLAMTSGNPSNYVTNLNNPSNKWGVGFVFDNAIFGNHAQGLKSDYSDNGGYAVPMTRNQINNLYSLMLWADVKNTQFMVENYPNLMNLGQQIYGPAANSFGFAAENQTWYATSMWQSSPIILRTQTPNVPLGISPIANPPTVGQLNGGTSTQNVANVYFNNAWFWLSSALNPGNKVGSNVINPHYFMAADNQADSVYDNVPMRELLRNAVALQQADYLYGEGRPSDGSWPWQGRPYLHNAREVAFTIGNSDLVNATAPGEVTGYLPTIGQPTALYYNGAVDQSDFASVGVNLDSLFSDLVTNGYIDAFGVIQKKLITLLASGSSNLGLTNTADQQKNQQIFGVLKNQTYYQASSNPNALIVQIQQANLDAFMAKLSAFTVTDFLPRTVTVNGNKVSIPGDPAYSNQFLAQYQVTNDVCQALNPDPTAVNTYNDPQNIFSLISRTAPDGSWNKPFGGFNTTALAAWSQQVFDNPTNSSLAASQLAQWNQFSATSSTSVDPCSNVPAQIVTQPQSQTVSLGQKATFSVKVNAVGTISYNWFYSKTGSNFVSVGGDTPNLTTSSVGNYFVVISNSGNKGVVSNTVTLTVH